jgi:G3E family GTPase
MEAAVMRLFSRRESQELPRFERLIIEPSGLSDPAPIAQAILRNPVMSRALRLEAIVTTVDAVFGEAQLARHPESRKQIALADCLVLTKTDLVPPDNIDRLRRRLGEENPAAPVITVSHGAVPSASLFPPGFFGPEPAAPYRLTLFADSVDPDHLGSNASASLTADRPLSWRAFDSWLRRIRIAHAEQLLRVKGMLDIEGVDGPVVVQGVHHVLNAPVELDAWPAGERKSRLVLIADRATIVGARESWAKAVSGIVAN